MAKLVKVKLVSFHLELLSVKEKGASAGCVLLFKDEWRVLLKAVTWLLNIVPACMRLQCLCVFMVVGSEWSNVANKLEEN